MGLGRNKCVIRGVTQRKVIPHVEFIDRIRKSLYFGCETLSDNMEVSRPLAEYASELFSEPHKGHSLNRLHKVTAGGIRASPCSLIMALIYLDRLNATDPSYVRRITPSELFIVSMMISTKFYSGHDEEIYLSDWAKDGNITEDRLKKLELEFLCAIEWNIYISNNEFFAKLESVEKSLAHREGLRRGWLTYTELINFLPTFTLAKFLLNNIAVMAVSYAASVMTIAGAFFLVSHLPGNALRKIDNDVTSVANTNLSKSTTTDLLNVETSTNEIESYKNSICLAINIEDELRKLEKQYDEESVLDRTKKNNENAGPLINFNQNYLFKSSRVEMKDSGINWHNFMDGGNAQNNCDDLANCTKILFWNLLADADAFVQIPLMWFKFI